MNIFQQFIKSLYSPETIAKFRLQKIGRAILYVFLLMVIATLPAVISLSIGINTIYNEFTSQLEEFPDFEIENGVLQSDAGSEINEAEDGTAIIFDPDGEYSSQDVTEYDQAFAFLEREAVFYTGATTEQVSYQELGIEISKDELNELTDTIGGMMPLILTVVGLIIYAVNTGLKFIGVTFLALISLILKRNQVNDLSFKQGWILSAFTVTLPTMIFAVIDMTGIVIPFSFGLYWLIAVIMMYLVIKNIRLGREHAREKRNLST
ncbi:DUF1189 domain-containing protein [Salisediminibacterium halotolerans]|uniref:Maltodextrin utilization protein YvdJ n=1 Tax=Salisediminibacterium halotolerans TaxID=517425 RepID=A0A1H9S9J5_9BACI|nr:DUF1189 domain-containing protein [Salisediminibacterium haloalkalitolerans]SER81588.1 Protein of unknown function [Salisediminibacterium haloalkalitolerans]